VSEPKNGTVTSRIALKPVSEAVRQRQVRPLQGRLRASEARQDRDLAVTNVVSEPGDQKGFTKDQAPRPWRGWRRGWDSNP
jgi:hypothetical protein